MTRTKPARITRAKDVRTGDLVWQRGNVIFRVTVNETGDYRFTLVNIDDETRSFRCNGNLYVL